jgi:hypothetical protein
MWVALVLGGACTLPGGKGSDESSTAADGAGGEDVGPGDDGSGDGGTSDDGAGDGGDDGKMDDGPTTDGTGDDGTTGGDTGGDTGATKPGALDGTWTGALYIEVTDLGLAADCIDGGVTLHVSGPDVEGTGGCFVDLLGGDDKVHLDLVGTVSGATMSGTLHGSTSVDSFDTTWAADFPHSKINLWGEFEAKTAWFAYDGRFSLTRK